MRSESVIVLAPGFKLLPGVGQIEEQVRIQTFVAQAAVEALDKAVFRRPAWPDEVELHAILIRPNVHHPAAKLGAVVDRDRDRQAAARGQDVEAGDDLLPSQRQIRP